MTIRSWRPSGVVLLAGSVLVLLPALAWLQYSWLDEVADADRDRRTRTVRTTASQLASDLDTELGRALTSLQLDALTVTREAWTDYDQRYSDWASTSPHPAIVEAVYLVQRTGHGETEAGARDGVRLRRWDSRSATFADAPWPSDLVSLEPQFRRDVSRVEVMTGVGREPGSVVHRGTERPFPLPTPLEDGRTVIVPVVHIPGPRSPSEDGSHAARTRLLGFTLLRFNLSVIQQEVLPALVRRHFSGAEGESEYRVAVVERARPETVIYESDAGTARVALDRPDASTPLLTPRIRPMFLSGTRDRAAAGPQRPDTPADVLVSALHARRDGRDQVRVTRREVPDGHWQLVVRHRAGSLETAVATARLATWRSAQAFSGCLPSPSV